MCPDVVNQVRSWVILSLTSIGSDFFLQTEEPTRCSSTNSFFNITDGFLKYLNYSQRFVCYFARYLKKSIKLIKIILIYLKNN